MSLKRLSLLAVLALGFAGSPPALRADNLPAQPIHVQNDTSRPIWVAAWYRPPGSGDFLGAGFWKIEPGQKMRIVYNGNARYMYVHAQDGQGGVLRRQGNPIRRTIRGQAVDLYQFDTGDDYNPRIIHIY